MMNKYFTSADLVIFYVTAAFQAVLVLTILSRGIHRRFPLFAALNCFWFVNDISLYAQSFWLSPMNYAYSYFAGSFIGYILIASVVWNEVYLNSYGPARSLPRWVPRQLIIFASILWLALLCVGIFLPVHQTSLAISMLYGIDRIAHGGFAAGLLVLIAYSIKIRIHWRRHVLAIAGGLCFYLSVDLVVAYSRYILPSTSMAAVRLISMVAYLLALSSWAFIMLFVRDPGPIAIDPLEVKALSENFKTTLAAAEAWNLHIDRSIPREGRV